MRNQKLSLLILTITECIARHLYFIVASYVIGYLLDVTANYMTGSDQLLLIDKGRLCDERWQYEIKRPLGKMVV